MVTEQELLSSILTTTQLSQYVFSLATDAAASHGIRSALRMQLQEHDRVESEIQIIAAQRGWDLNELQPATRWLAGLRFRCRSDSSIAEYMINLHTQDSIRLLKLRNQCNSSDGQILTLFQKYLDCKTISVRQMQPYL